MRAQATRHTPERSAAQRQHPRWTRPAGYLLELSLIAGIYVLLGWVGHRLRLDGRVIIFWPAGGFALAALLLRGSSRWPAILLGSLVVTWRWGLAAGAVETEVPAALVAALASGGRTLSTVVTAWLMRRATGVRSWPHTTRGVILATLLLGLLAPALVAVTSQAALWLGGVSEAGLGLAGEMWVWFVANSIGALLVAPLLLVLAQRREGGPSPSRRELGLMAVAFVPATLFCFTLARDARSGMPMAYPLFPLMVWACLRFGSQGAALANVLWAGVLIAVALLSPGEASLALVFTDLHVRLAFLSAVILVLAAAFEERYRLQQALEAERQRAQQRVVERTRELASSLSLLHSSLESTADGLLVVDRQGRIALANQRFLDMWRIPRTILESGEDARALAYVQDQLLSPDSFSSKVQFLYDHPELESEDELALKDGRVLERFSRPQHLGDALVGRVWSFRDVTLRRRMEAERNWLLREEAKARQDAERAAGEAQTALALREEFLQVAAHEMKTPLTSMKLQLQQLVRLVDGASGRPPEPQRLASGITATLRALRRFEELGDQLLDVKRLGAGAPEARFEPLDFRAVVAEQLEAFRELAVRAGSELHLESGSHLPGESDHQRLAQIVGCLLSNALKFGAGAPVTVRLEGSAERVRLQVVDRGIGIAPEDQQRILERFGRAVDSRHYGGLGLGLWLARQSVEVLGGQLDVQSAPGQGSTFTVELPRRRPPRPSAPERDAAGEATHS